MKKILSRILTAIITLGTIAVIAVMAYGVVTGGGAKRMDKDTEFTFMTNPMTKWSYVADTIPLNLVLDMEDSKLTLKKDGTFTFRVMINPAILKLLNGDEEFEQTKKLLEGFGLDISGLLATAADMDLKDPAGKYAVPIMPGFTTDHVQSSLALLESLDAHFVGLDYNDPNVQKMIKSIEETGHLNADLVLPNQFGFEINSTYEIITETDSDGKEHTIIMVAGEPRKRESFLMFEMTDNEETGKRELFLRVEFLMISLHLEEAK